MTVSNVVNNVVLAAASNTDTSTGSDVINQLLPFLNFGIVGVLVVLIATKRVFVPKWSLDDLRETHEVAIKSLEDSHARELAARDTQIGALEEDKRELKGTNEKLTQLTQEKILPALFEANRLAALQVEVITRRVNGTGSGV